MPDADDNLQDVLRKHSQKPLVGIDRIEGPAVTLVQLFGAILSTSRAHELDAYSPIAPMDLILSGRASCGPLKPTSRQISGRLLKKNLTVGGMVGVLLSNDVGCHLPRIHGGGVVCSLTVCWLEHWCLAFGTGARLGIIKANFPFDVRK